MLEGTRDVHKRETKEIGNIIGWVLALAWITFMIFTRIVFRSESNKLFSEVYENYPILVPVVFTGIYGIFSWVIFQEVRKEKEGRFKLMFLIICFVFFLYVLIENLWCLVLEASPVSSTGQNWKSLAQLVLISII